MTKKAVSRRLKPDDRVFKQLADQTIKKDPVRALVELITNSDDSYKRLERLGIEHDGQITMKFKRTRDRGKFIVIDHAEGMGSEKMDQAVGVYGSKTHGFEAGQGGRSFWGRGLKEAILSMGQGFVKSIHNNFLHESLLNIRKYEREVPRETVQIHKDDLEIPSRGTHVTLVATRSGITIPQFETLKRSLELYFSLHDILSSPNRNVWLTELDHNDDVKHEVKLSYVSPKGQLVLKKNHKLRDFNDADVSLQVFKSDEELPGREDGYIRQNGVLICSKGAIHDITLFKYEGEELALNLFGRLTCDKIDELLRDDEPIITDSRDGMDWSHPLNKTLRLFAERELETYVSEERKKQQSKGRIIESDKLKKKFKKTLKKLNSIAAAELSDIGTAGRGEHEGSMLPPNGFDFVPNYYHILVGKKTTLTLKMGKERFMKKRAKVDISSDSPNVIVLNKKLRLKQDMDRSVITDHVYIEGKQIGEEARVIAIAGDLRTEAKVHVIAMKEKTRQTRKRRHRGMFKDIQYNPYADPNQRVRFDKDTGVIVIATSAPSVRLYLGSKGEGIESPESLVMTSELVCQAVCRELARIRIQSGQEPMLGEPEEALNVVYNRLISKYAHVIHSILGP